MEDGTFVLRGQWQDLIQGKAARRLVDQSTVGHQTTGGHQGGRLGQPGRIPQRANLVFRLVSRPGTAVEAGDGGWIQEQGSHCTFGLPSMTVNRPSGLSENFPFLHCTPWPRKLAHHMRNASISRIGMSHGMAGEERRNAARTA